MLALKKAEATDEVIVRVVELDGKPAENVHIAFAAPVSAAREVNGQEQAIGSANIKDGALTTSFTAYQPRTFALRLAPPTSKRAPIHSESVALQYDLAVASNDDTKTEGGGFDGKGNAIPAEMLPKTINYNGVEFNLAPAKTGSPNAVVAKGQTVNLPAGQYNRVYILAAVVGRGSACRVQDWRTSGQSEHRRLGWFYRPMGYASLEALGRTRLGNFRKSRSLATG